jgi:ribosome-binding ATPase YchF (GTP1/OBG family)
MKIANTGLDLPQGKIKYNDKIFVDFVEKFQPKKVSPYYFEFLPDDYESADIIVMTAESVLDLLILDMEKIESRLSRTEDPAEVKVLEKCLAQLEDHKPICDLPLDNAERAIVRALKLLSFTPTLVYKDALPDSNTVCRDGMEKAGTMFFYTVGKQEVHAWLVEKGNDAVTCAGKIHSDLARGFVKAEIISCEDMMTAHNMQDARSKELTKLVGREYVIPTNCILDIRFNV